MVSRNWLVPGSHGGNQRFPSVNTLGTSIPETFNPARGSGSGQVIRHPTRKSAEVQLILLRQAAGFFPYPIVPASPPGGKSCLKGYYSSLAVYWHPNTDRIQLPLCIRAPTTTCPTIVIRWGIPLEPQSLPAVAGCRSYGFMRICAKYPRYESNLFPTADHHMVPATATRPTSYKSGPKRAPRATNDLQSRNRWE